MNPKEFRKELIKILPGYKWTIHKNRYLDSNYLVATGIQTAGLNRLSTLQVVKRKKDDQVEYDVKSSGFGTKSPWLSEYTDTTFARALRGLQSYYENMAATYSNHAGAIKYARQAKEPT